MRKGRPLPILKLRSEARDTLERGARRPKSAPALAPRARVVLAGAQEKTPPGVSTELKLSRPAVGKGRRRLVRPGRDGRLEEPRPGARRPITDAQVERGLSLTLESPPQPATHGSPRSGARKCGRSPSAVSRIWRALALHPHRSETFKLSRNPLFVEKVRDRVGLYWNPPDGAWVLGGDAKAPMQALDRTPPRWPRRPGQVERRTQD